jgi:hypothetical protein
MHCSVAMWIRRPNQDHPAEDENHKLVLLFTDKQQGVLRAAVAFSKNLL